MNARRFLIAWQRARRTGRDRDLDLAAYCAFVAGGTIFLAVITGALGPTLDAQHQGASAERHAAR
jgi:hypothetical protein